MRYKELLNEYVEQVRDPAFGTIIPVQVNPTSKTLKDFLAQSDYQELRGLFDERGKFYFWDAGYLIHSDMADQLGIDIKSSSMDPRLVIRQSSFKGGPIIAMHHPESYTGLEKNPYFSKLFNAHQMDTTRYFTLKE